VFLDAVGDMAFLTWLGALWGVKVLRVTVRVRAESRRCLTAPPTTQVFAALACSSLTALQRLS
jgi:hypothetical protein